jgi:hypothetical protein
VVRFWDAVEGPMKAYIELPEDQPASRTAAEGDNEKRTIVLHEIEKILASPFFRNAARSRQFLKFVVEHQLEGHPEQLKERTIGTEVFLRPSGYATGDDPVVRVQAGEVRRRLEQYYQVATEDPPVRIELPVGSYSPVFHWSSPATTHPVPKVAPRALTPVPVPEPEPLSARPRIRFWLIAAICSLIALAAVFGFITTHRQTRQKSTLEQFWNPVFATQQPVLICLAKPIAYRPSQDIYDRYSRKHPGTFQNEAERSNQPLPLDPNEKLSWGDMYIYSDYGVSAGDVYAAVTLSGLLGKIGKPSQVRIGTNYSFEDLRNSPAVVVGAFNNKWTMQLTSTLHYTFVEQGEDYSIREQAPGTRVWRTRLGNRGETIEDFALVSRLLDSKTGQFTITAAGVGPNGTQAAGEFVSNAKYLEEGLRDAPPDWQNKNLEILLQTTVTDSVAGPPHAVAAYYW